MTSLSSGTGKIIKTNYKINKEDFYNESDLTTESNNVLTDISISILSSDLTTDITLSSSNIDENNSIGDIIGSLSTTDLTNVFTLVSGEGDTDNSSFTISGSNLLANQIFDYETKNSYSIRIRATNSNDNTFDKQFTITINNINEAPTNITLNTNFIYENNSIGRNIGKFTTTAQDSNTFTYSLDSSLDNSSFTIENNILKANVVFDYSVKNNYSIKVRSTNEHNLYIEKIFTINIYEQKENIEDLVISEPITVSGVVIHEPDVPIVLDKRFFGESVTENTLNDWITGNDNSGTPAIVKVEKTLGDEELPRSNQVLKLVSPDNEPYEYNGVLIQTTPEYLGVEQIFTSNIDGNYFIFVAIVVSIGSSALSIQNNGQTPCFTNTCNILTPNGYKNVSFLKENEIVLTSDHRQLKIEKIYKASCCTKKCSPRLIKKNQYGKNKPFVDTHISENHMYKIKRKWTKPKYECLMKQWNNKIVTYYHLKLPNHSTDNLIVNGMIMESWDGIIPSLYKL